MDFRSLLFWRKPPIADLDSFADFIDQRAAFVVQKGIFEYSRARAGHYAKVLFQEPAFHEAVEQSRWGAYPLGLAMVGELAEGILRPYAGPDSERQLKRLSVLTLSVYDRYTKPDAIAPDKWLNGRADISRYLKGIATHPTKRAMDVAEPYVKTYFDLMPIHKQLRASDYPTLRNYLRITMCNIHDDLSDRMDAPAISRLLLEGPDEAPHLSPAAAGGP